MIARSTLMAASAILGVYVAVFVFQTQVLRYVQSDLLAITLPYEVINPLHGVRMIAAWLFGWWSVLILLPAILFFYLVYFLQGATFGPEFHLVALAYVVSAPLAFTILRTAIPDRPRPSRFEWRSIVLAGAISAFANSLAYGTLRSPYPADASPLVWLAGHMLSQVLGLVMFLAIAMLALRWFGPMIERHMSR